MAGLFSTLDGLFQSSLEQILAGLPLSEELTAALLRHEGPIGEILAFVLAHEREPGAGADGLSLPAAEINRCYATALAWADDTMGALS
jgi:EAL and modified HD-GYP domain-containing signal transduction protein